MVQTNGSKRLTGAEKLRALLADPDKTLGCPGVYDGYTARIALQEGFDCLYMVRCLPHSALCSFFGDWELQSAKT